MMLCPQIATDFSISNCQNKNMNLHELNGFSRQACYDALTKLTNDNESDVSSISTASTDTTEHEMDHVVSGGLPAPPAQAVGAAVALPLPGEVHVERRQSISKSDSVNGVFEGVNPYMRVMLAVGSTLMEYDTDKVVPLMGFGGRVAGENRINHCFPLAEDFEVNNMNGVVDAYISWYAKVNCAVLWFF
jgi:hypothetical protein